MEIERKFLLTELPDLKDYQSHKIEQAYLCTNPVVRVRREDESYYMTYKGRGMLVREEYNLPLNKEAYEHLKEKADGNVIGKTRYLVPLDENGLIAEVDVFDAPFAPQRASFQEHDGTDAGTVMDGIFLNVEDTTGHL